MTSVKMSEILREMVGGTWIEQLMADQAISKI